MKLDNMLITLLFLSIAGLETAHAFSISCRTINEKNPAEYSSWLLTQNADETFKLNYQAVDKNLARYESELYMVDIELAKSMKCHFGKGSVQVISCVEKENLPVDPTIRGPTGPIDHKFKIIHTVVTSMSDNGDETREGKVTAQYSREQMIWAAPIHFTAKGIKSGKILPLEILDGSLRTNKITLCNSNP
jgi:hypothetical protein